MLVKELTVEGQPPRPGGGHPQPARTRSARLQPLQLTEDLRAIFALGFFDDVQARVEDFEGGVKVTLVVMERPFVRDVEFVGNKKLPPASCRIRSRSSWAASTTRWRCRKPRTSCRSTTSRTYFEVQVTPEVERSPAGTSRSSSTSTRAGSPSTASSSRATRASPTRRSRRPEHPGARVFHLPRKLERQKLDEDVERILNLYNDHGFIQARVEGYDMVVDREKARVTVTFRLVEGPQYRVDQVRIQASPYSPRRRCAG